MPKLSLWNYRKTNDYTFIDNNIREMIDISGTPILVHKYMGVKDQGAGGTELKEKGDVSQPNYLAIDGELPNETKIQDLLLLENRDRRYDPSVYELRGLYQVSDNDFNLTQFGIFLTADTVYISFHINEMVERMGRKLMSGDVLELPHLREDLFLDESKPAANKYYVVEDANREASGFSPTWYPHIWRVKCSPMQNQQEFIDILQGPVTDIQGNEVYDENNSSAGMTLEDAISDMSEEISITEALVAEADRRIPYRNYEHAHLYLFCGDDGTAQYPPCIHFGDGIPPGGQEVFKMESFPPQPVEGMWVLRTDYEPYVLFQRTGPIWKRREADWRKNWSQANRVLETFINDKNVLESADGKKYKERQYLSKVVKPKVDFEGNYPKNDPRVLE